MLTEEIISLIRRKSLEKNLNDFYIFSYDRSRLIIAGSSDISYYHNLEVIFFNPLYIEGETEWKCDLDNKVLSIGAVGKEIIFYNDEGRIIFRVVSETIDVNFDTVFYYRRKNLKEGQRLAY